ncbi:uncharacterized protein LOC118026991 [Mirounga leonina]|uniref:uncharacterized protein LOC118026991 n=1 Tax=Mirounga leonina TaxID=9715 RepID=UPI00156C03DA|nr:uncharacterized protein LOC118026991 [Mirounga leonina]
MPASLGQRKARGEGETGDSGLTPGFFRFLLKVGRPPFPSPSRPHPRVQRGRGLPQAAASASSPRGSWCLPGPTGLTRTTQPQDVRSDGTTASCHAPPLPPPPASSPPRISPPTPPSRAQDESEGEGERFTSYVQGRVYLCYPLFLLFRNSTFLLNRSEIGLGGRGPEAGHGLGGRVDERRKPSDSEKHREPEEDHGRKIHRVAELKRSEFWVRKTCYLTEISGRGRNRRMELACFNLPDVKYGEGGLALCVSFRQRVVRH